jgi:hypothetical protein
MAAAVEAILSVLQSNATWPERIQRTREIAAHPAQRSALPANMQAVLVYQDQEDQRAAQAILSDQSIAETVTRLGERVAVAMSWQKNLQDVIEPEPIDAELRDFRGIAGNFVPAPSISFCVAANPIIEIVRARAELCLENIRACRSIAGLELDLEPYAPPTVFLSGPQRLGIGDTFPSPWQTGFQPLPYRYATLVERARQLVDLARQMEASMLAFIESGERAHYEEVRARQDLSLAQAGVRLKDLQLNHAIEGVYSAQLQRNRAVLQRDHYQDLLRNGNTTNEDLALTHYSLAASANQAAAFQAAFSPQAVFSWGAASTTSTAAAISDMAQVFSTSASYERREQDWRLQIQLGGQDVRIGQEQIRLANSQVRLAQQEKDIANLQFNNARDTVDFLVTRRFTTTVLYEWMSGVLEGIYRFFLQQATSMSKLAEQQLTFERQEVPAAFIQEDYWIPPSKGMTPDFGQSPNDSQAANVRGLTGSARLLRDLYELDQYAFRTNQRKLQLSETISLAQIDPFAFQRFRETGVLPFATPMRTFDQKFPGHYLRLIRRVRTSVIALIPPTLGIRATLSTVGTSRVVIGKDLFQEVVMQRGPEMVALTSPINATGLFELDVQPELLVPFEGIGVDTTWEFRMPKAANQFDYATIADILITIDYTALFSYDYQQRLRETLERQVSANRAYSFRSDFPDQWYDLHNADLLEEAQQMIVRFRCEREDFPPNLDRLSIQHVVLYFFSQDGWTVPIENVNLQYAPDATALLPPEDAKPINGKVSTRASAWNGVIGQPLPGEWIMSFRPAANDLQTAQKLAALLAWFKSEKKGQTCEDILFVITYSGRLPAWPV